MTGIVPTLRVGVHSMQGKRRTMEDKHLAFGPDEIGDGYLVTPSNGSSGEPEKRKVRSDVLGLYCVFDGHGGPKAAEYAHEHLPQLVLGADESIGVEECIREAIRKIDKDFLTVAADAELADGTTATVVAITKDGMCIVGNVGDSEAVLARESAAPAPSEDSKDNEAKSPTINPVPLSVVHNVAQNEDEGTRVINAGGNIFHNRLGHPCLNPAYFSIAVSRAIGDLMFKADSYTDGKPSGLTAEPDFRSTSITSTDKFIVIACDGLWSVVDHARVIHEAHKEIQTHGASSLDNVAKAIADLAFAEGSTDNITVMVVMLAEGIAA